MVHEMLSASDPEEFASRKRKGCLLCGWQEEGRVGGEKWQATRSRDGEQRDALVHLFFDHETSVTAEKTVGNEPTVIVDRDLV